MRETLLHIREEVSEAQIQALEAALSQRAGSRCASERSAKPHLLFVRYDEQRMAPGALVEAAASEGLHARLVEL